MKKLLLFNASIIIGLSVYLSSGWVMGQGVSSGDTLFKSSEESNWARITLNAETNNLKTSTQISYNENMSRGLDVGYDAGFLNSNSGFALFSRLVEDNGNAFGVQCLPIEYEDLVIPIGLDAKAGDVIAFSASATDIPEQYAVVLEDRNLATFTNLSDSEARYTIQLIENCNGIGRFFLRTSLKSTLGIRDDLKLENVFQIITKPVENELLIRGESKIKTTVRIYSITGNLVADIVLKKQLNNSVHFSENAGIYIVQIRNDKRTLTQKFFWVK